MCTSTAVPTEGSNDHPHRLLPLEDGIADADLANIAAALDELPVAVPAIRTYRHGANLGVSPMANCDYAIVATFDDVDGWRAYDTHPRHLEVRTEVLEPWIAERFGLQFT